MLDYEWGSPSTVMLTADESPTNQVVSDPTQHILDHYTQNFNDTTLVNPNNGFTPPHHHPQHRHFLQTQTQTQSYAHAHFNSLYEYPRAYGECVSYAPPAPSSMLSLEPLSASSAGPSRFMAMPKSEPDFTSRIGLNLGGRTYFSSAEDEFVNRLYRRSRPMETGLINSPRCQAEGCNADLTHAKHYHRRHKVCEFHSKTSTVIAAGLTQRFCQQCSRFHLLSEFDNGKRSCRKRLADHNRRRRKSSQQLNQDQSKSHLSTTRDSSVKNLARSPPDSGAQSSSSVTIAVSPPRISLDCFGQRSYEATASTSSASTSSFFFSNG